MEENKQICFTVSGQKYAIPILDVRSVEKYENVAPAMVGFPDYVDGVINIRGELTPVYSIRYKFHLPEQSTTKDKSLIIVNLGELSVAIEVDSIVGIIDLEEKVISDKPQMLNNSDTDFVGHVAEVNGIIMLVVDLKYLIPDDERQAMLDILDKDK